MLQELGMVKDAQDFDIVVSGLISLGIPDTLINFLIVGGALIS